MISASANDELICQSILLGRQASPAKLYGRRYRYTLHRWWRVGGVCIPSLPKQDDAHSAFYTHHRTRVHDLVCAMLCIARSIVADLRTGLVHVRRLAHSALSVACTKLVVDLPCGSAVDLCSSCVHRLDVKIKSRQSCQHL